VLRINVPSSSNLKEGGKPFTAYTVECRYGEATWTTSKRYSQFLDLKTKMDKDLVTVSAPFPKKGFGTLGAAALEKRREQLDAYMAELSGAFLPEHLYDYLCLFVEMKAGLAKAAAGAGGSAAAVAPPVPPSADAEADAAASPQGGEEGGGKVAWDASFMNQDPLAGFLGPDPTPEQAAAAPAAKPKPVPKAEVAPPPSAGGSAAAASPSPAAAPPPGFFSSFGSKTYPATGEGLRDAIKDKDVSGIKQVLKQNPETANYQDRLSQTMLHLAAIFDHTEIAELLLASGADPSVKNSDGETAIDVAQPTLKRKIKAAVEANA